MNHGGFGSLKVIHRGVDIKIPKDFLFNDGRLKGYAIKYINRQIEKINAQLDRKEIC